MPELPGLTPSDLISETTVSTSVEVLPLPGPPKTISRGALESMTNFCSSVGAKSEGATTGRISSILCAVRAFRAFSSNRAMGLSNPRAPTKSPKQRYSAFWLTFLARPTLRARSF